MKTTQELLDFYGVEIGKKYEITQTKYPYLGTERIFIVEMDKAEDKARIRFIHEDGSLFLGNTAISLLSWCDYHEVKPLLTNEEKDYLKTVIKPFRDSIITIEKLEFPNNKACIYIEYRHDDGAEDRTYMPMFNVKDLYLGMKSNKRYTLEELGL